MLYLNLKSCLLFFFFIMFNCYMLFNIKPYIDVVACLSNFDKISNIFFIFFKLVVLMFFFFFSIFVNKEKTSKKSKIFQYICCYFECITWFNTITLSVECQYHGSFIIWTFTFLCKKKKLFQLKSSNKNKNYWKEKSKWK